jgi:hypothetical protein
VFKNTISCVCVDAIFPFKIYFMVDLTHYNLYIKIVKRQGYIEWYLLFCQSYSEGHVSLGTFGEQLLNNIWHNIMSQATLGFGFP